MTPHQAAARWQKRQAELLTRSYLRAWETGVKAYRSQYATPPTAARQTAPAPTKPLPQPMGRALAPAMASLATMAAQIAAVIPTALVLAGTAPTAAYQLAISGFIAKNAWRVGLGVSVIWAAEQLGYAQAATADGLLLTWQLDPRADHCADCPALAALPAMPLSWWPTMPGEGATQCNVGCRCSLKAVPARQPVLSPAQELVISRIGNQQTPVPIAA